MPTGLRSIAVEDEVNAIVDFGNGATGHFMTCTHDMVGTDRLEMLFDKGKVVCSAERFSNQWPQLGGARIGPYVCAIGKRTLRITTAATYYDRNGHRLKSDDPMLAAKAARVIESGFKWTWK